MTGSAQARRQSLMQAKNRRDGLFGLGLLLSCVLFFQFFPPSAGLAADRSVERLTERATERQKMEQRKKVTPVTSKHWTNKYDRHFRKYTKRYFGPGVDWHWFKSQGIAESALQPKVKSHAGAIGIMQILPSTFADIRRENPHFRSIVDPRWNIAAGIWYDRSLYKYWQKKVPAKRDRLALTFASYNAGLGTMQKAWKRTQPAETAKSGSYWETMAKRSPTETRGYVSRIRELMQTR